MLPYYYWLIATAVLVILELVTAGFGVICFAIGTLIAAVLAYFELGLEYQISAFIVGSILALIFIRPFALKWLNKHKGEQVQTNADAIIGRKAVVTETIDASKGTGYVKIDGDMWKAVSQTGAVIEAGVEVTVISRESIILTVNR
ncbi:MAG: NfeD family protein [Paludibacteraceae bacterium]|nr:NfeD family protein [Paludibacteraceae bacterium]